MLLKFARAIIANTIYSLFELLILSSTFRLMAADGLFIPTSYSSPLGIADRARCLRLPFSSAVALWEGGPLMNALLCRVGADQSLNGGSWNGLVDSKTGKFVYVAIPEGRQVHAGLTTKPVRRSPNRTSFISFSRCEGESERSAALVRKEKLRFLLLKRETKIHSVAFRYETRSVSSHQEPQCQVPIS